MIQVIAITIRSTDTGKTSQIGTAKRQGTNPQRQRVEHRAGGATNLFKQRSQAAGIHCHIKLFALTESQRATQKQEVGYGNVGQSHIQANHFIAIQVQQHGCAASFDQQTFGNDLAICILVLDALVVWHGANQGLSRARYFQRGAATLVHVHRDVAADDFEHVAQTIHAQFVSVCRERKDTLSLHPLG